MLTLLTFYLASGLVLIVLSIPLWLQKVGPNRWYGFRIAPVYATDDVWYATNKYAAKWLAAVGGATILAAGILYYVPGLSIDLYAIGCLFVVVAVGVPGMLLSWRRAKELVSAPH